MVQNGHQKWLEGVTGSQKWPKIAENVIRSGQEGQGSGSKWPEIAKNGQKWPKITGCGWKRLDVIGSGYFWPL